MLRSPPLLLLGLVLSACAADPPKAPVCDGLHRRPVNLYPSVLRSGSLSAPPQGPAAAAPPAHPGC